MEWGSAKSKIFLATRQKIIDDKKDILVQDADPDPVERSLELDSSVCVGDDCVSVRF